MWGIAETQFKTITDNQARERAAAREQRLARAATKAKRGWQPDRRAPDAQLHGKPAAA